MTGYEIKGIIGFLLALAVLVFTIFTGDFSGAGYVLMYLVGGMILYQIGRFMIRIITGWDPDSGAIKSSRALHSTSKKSHNKIKVGSNSMTREAKESWVRLAFFVVIVVFSIIILSF
jgi:hypothetical protein